MLYNVEIRFVKRIFLNKVDVVTLLRPLKYTLIFIVIAAVLLVAATVMLKYWLTQGRTEDYTRFENRLLQLEKEMLTDKLSAMTSDIIYLTYTFEVYNGMYEGAYYDKLEENWSAFLKGRDTYFKLRYIDTSGMEKIKINYTKTDGIRISPPFELEDKTDRYYLKDVANLRKNQIYISKIDLNVENNKISYPYTPVLRLISPVFGSFNVPQGYIVLSCDARDILTAIEEMAQASSGSTYLLNAEGNWLYHSGRDGKALGFLNAADNSFKADNPEVWEHIDKYGAGELVTEDGLYVFMTAPPYSVQKVEVDITMFSAEGPLMLVAFIPNNVSRGLMFSRDLRALVEYTFGNKYILLLITIVISALIVFLIAVIQRENRKKREYQHDALSCAYNRGAGFKLLEKTYAKLYKKQHRGIKTSLSICFIDINGLKTINDTLGHEAGDKLISEVSSSILKVIDELGFMMRIGGDEFLLVFPELGADKAEKLWQQIQEEFTNADKCSSDTICNNESDMYKISVSHGIAEFTFEPGETIDKVINLADEMMYTEKKITRSASR